MAGYDNFKKQDKIVAAGKLNESAYVDQAKEVILTLQEENNKKLLTTNKIRNMLTLINELYNKAKYTGGDKISSQLQSHVMYIKMRFVYEAGRDDQVKKFVLKSRILEYMDQVGDSRDKLILLCHYMEALVAYHRYYTLEK